MSKTLDNDFWRWNNPVLWGVAMSAIIFGLMIVMSFLPICTAGECQPKWRYFVNASPNEVGDTLAGFAGTLAFVWIIVTVAMQSLELKEQRKVLALQKEEMVEQRIATQEMAQAMAAQARVFEDEQRQRLEIEADRNFEREMHTLVELCREQMALNLDNNLLLDGFYLGVTAARKETEFFRQLAVSSGKHLHRLELSESDTFDGYGETEFEALSELHNVVSRINGYSERLSEPMKAIHDYYGFDSLQSNIEAVQQRPEWHVENAHKEEVTRQRHTP